MNPLSQNKAWSYVGRFVLKFATIENTANQLFLELIGGVSRHKTGGALDPGIFLTYTLHLRKKLELVNAILKDRGIDDPGSSSHRPLG
jgi:hypothetical protein